MTGRQMWALALTSSYREEYERLPSKFRNQLSRKAIELTYDPTPGGSKTKLVGHDRMWRVRAGDFRIVYTYNNEVVYLLSVRRRKEHTYEDLDEIDLPQLGPIRISELDAEGSSANSVIVASAQPDDGTRRELLPCPVTPKLLDTCGIPEEYRPALLSISTVDDLLDCQDVPLGCIEHIVEHIWPKADQQSAELPRARLSNISELVDRRAEHACGPIDARSMSGAADAASIASHEKVETARVAGADQRSEVLIVTTIRRKNPMAPYTGNTARGIAKDTRYTVKLNGKVALVYYVDNRETALLTTDDHPELVAMVNAAKRASGNGQDGGSFVINEYRHVLVPSIDGDQVIFAGVYTRDLEFRFEGSLISPVAPATIRPGDIWPGPHVGIRYTLAAGATDIRYDQQTDRGTQRRICLTDFHNQAQLAPLLDMCRRIKKDGGAVYINEARELFTPVDNGDGFARRYIGHLGTMPWFPAPQQ